MLEHRHLSWFGQLLQELALRPEITRPLNKSQRQLLQYCEDHALLADHQLAWQRERQFVWTRPLAEQLRALLLQQGHLPPEQLAALRQQGREAQLAQSPQELKSLGLKPRQQHILARLAPEQSPALASIYHWAKLDVQLLRQPWVLVENYDSFISIERSSLPSALGLASLLYRGDRFGSSGCASLLTELKQRGTPLWYLGDFDPAGLSIALQHCCGLLLPNALQLHPDNLANQWPILESLERTRSEVLAVEALKRMRQQGAAKQQGFSGSLIAYHWQDSLV